MEGKLQTFWAMLTDKGVAAVLYPLKLNPYFRHGEQTPWGGDALGSLFGKAIPDRRTGEALEVSALPGMQSVVDNGELAGAPLSQAISLWGAGLTGLDGEEPFPLMVKLLAAREALSVQVHPDDAYAAQFGKLGKSEAWVVLSAPPGAKLVYGLRAGAESLEQIVAQGRLEQALNLVNVYPGDVLYIPSGMVHALGGCQGDLVVYEIQQSSDITYRFWDWGRVDQQGRPRELHTQQALAVAKAELSLSPVSGATVLCQGGSVTYYIADRHFELSRLNVAGDMPLAAGRMLLITALGCGRLRWPQGQLELGPGQTALVPAGLEGAVLSGQLSALCSSTPNQLPLRALLGYRAGQVAGLTS